MLKASISFLFAVPPQSSVLKYCLLVTALTSRLYAVDRTCPNDVCLRCTSYPVVSHKSMYGTFLYSDFRFCEAQQETACYFFLLFFFSFISLIADEPHHYHPACGHKASSHLSPVPALQFFLSRCKFSTLTTRQLMVEFYLLTFPRFPLRKKEHKSYCWEYNSKYLQQFG